MKATRAYISLKDDGTFYVSCEVDVPGLGALTMSDCLSTETIQKVFQEVQSVARVKLGIGLNVTRLST